MGVGVGVAASPSSTPTTFTVPLSVKLADGIDDGGVGVGCPSLGKPAAAPYADAPVPAPIRTTPSNSVMRGAAGFRNVALPQKLTSMDVNPLRQI